jgi:hypothetical protein
LSSRLGPIKQYSPAPWSSMAPLSPMEYTNWPPATLAIDRRTTKLCLTKRRSLQVKV